MILIYLIHVFALITLSFLIINSLVNMAVVPTARRRRWDAESGAPPLVSVLVPARNEERCIADCVRSLRRQNYEHFEVIVLDDGSEDETASLVLNEGFEENPPAPFRLIKGEPLPDGWAGKPWACAQLARQARGEYLLFVDADTVHHPDMLASAIMLALESKAHLLSAWPRQITHTWAERMIIPMLYVFGIGFGFHWLIALLQKFPQGCRWIPQKSLRQTGMANGQFMLFQREAYEELGTHERVKDHLVEDVALGRAVVEKTGEGWRLINCDGRHLVLCRMYENFRGVWEGFSKNVRPAFEDARGLFLVTGFVLIASLIMPFVWLFVPGQFWMGLFEVLLVLLFRMMLAIRFNTDGWSVMWHPFAMCLAIGIGINSWRWAILGRVQWKQRAYDWKPN